MTGQVVEYARRRAGEYLRVIATYSENNIDLRYIRDDIKRQRAHGTTRLLVEDLAEEETPPERLRQTFGRQYASLRVFPNICVVHIPSAGATGQGLIVGLEREAGKNLSEFIEECAVRWERGLI